MRQCRECHKTFAAIESGGVIVLCIDNKRERLGVASQHTQGRVGEQRAAQTPAMEMMIHRQAANQRGG